MSEQIAVTLRKYPVHTRACERVSLKRNFYRKSVLCNKLQLCSELRNVFANNLPSRCTANRKRSGQLDFAMANTEIL